MDRLYSDGSYSFGGDLTLPYIWVSLHMNAELAAQSEREAWHPQEAARFTEQLNFLCRSLRDVPAERWVAICQAAGWTVLGAVGLSWCAGATFDQVCKCWHVSGYDLRPDRDGTRPAQTLNPDILPASHALSEIVRECEGQELAICITLAARETPIAYDLPADVLVQASAMLSGFLLQRIENAAVRPEREDQLTAAWRANVERSGKLREAQNV